jgi:hypothetical protein
MIGPVSPDYISRDIMARTLRITFVGMSPLRTDVVTVLKGFGFDQQKHGLSALYQRDRSRDFFAVLKNWEAVWRFSNLGQQVYKRYTVIFSDISAERVQLRVHWLPMYISNDFVDRVFSHLGKVVGVSSEYVNVQGIKLATGVRCVTLQVNERVKSQIPHKISTADGYSMLVTCRDRLPLCLKCNRLGHRRADCGQGRPSVAPPPSSYARVAARGLIDDDQNSLDDSFLIKNADILDSTGQVGDEGKPAPAEETTEEAEGTGKEKPAPVVDEEQGKGMPAVPVVEGQSEKGKTVPVVDEKESELESDSQDNGNGQRKELVEKRLADDDGEDSDPPTAGQKPKKFKADGEHDNSHIDLDSGEENDPQRLVMDFDSQNLVMELDLDIR